MAIFYILFSALFAALSPLPEPIKGLYKLAQGEKYNMNLNFLKTSIPIFMLGQAISIIYNNKKYGEKKRLFECQVNNGTLKKVEEGKISFDNNDIKITFYPGDLDFGIYGTKQFMISMENNKTINTNTSDPVFFDYEEFNKKLIYLVKDQAALYNQKDNFLESFAVDKEKEKVKRYKLNFYYKKTNQQTKKKNEEKAQFLKKVSSWLYDKKNYPIYERDIQKLQAAYPENKFFKSFTMEITFTKEE
jgi:hypothetical protein